MTIKELKEKIEHIPDHINVQVELTVIHQYNGDHDCESFEYDDFDLCVDEKDLTICCTERVDHRDEEYEN